MLRTSQEKQVLLGHGAFKAHDRPASPDHYIRAGQWDWFCTHDGSTEGQASGKQQGGRGREKGRRLKTVRNRKRLEMAPKIKENKFIF